MRLKTAIEAAKTASKKNTAESYFVAIDNNSRYNQYGGLVDNPTDPNALQYDYMTAREYYNSPQWTDEADVIFEIFDGEIEEVYSDQAAYLDAIED